jgi:uncharacterized radical SAM superfamily protein
MRLSVVILKPSKYDDDQFVERFTRGFMPNSTLAHIVGCTPSLVDGVDIDVHWIDEYVETSLEYLQRLNGARGAHTLVALVGVQSHQFHRALDLGAYALGRGCLAVMGGPHVMTCDTTEFQGRGLSFALSEAEVIWRDILSDAVRGELQPVYGPSRPWQDRLDPVTVTPPTRRQLRSYVTPLLGLYPARGCPFNCTFCSVVKIAGHKVRSQPIESTLESIRRAVASGVRWIMFTSDNFNKYPEAEDLLKGIIDERLDVKLFVQCDTQVERQEDFVALLGRAGCTSIFMGVESLHSQTLRAVNKRHNRPEQYERLIGMCRRHGIGAHFSNIIGFPSDTEKSVAENLRILKQLAPEWASFYVLCPIPGTEQYDEMRAQRAIVETNLDRFDATCLTWRHPHFDDGSARALLSACYRGFYDSRKLASYVLDAGRSGQMTAAAGSAIMWGFNRYCAWRGMHPMSGGIGRVRLDRASDYAPLRRTRFDIDRAPLPQSRPLASADRATVRIVRPGVQTTHSHHL